MDSYKKEMVLYYTNLWGSTGQPTFAPLSLEDIAEKNNDAALLLLFIHHLKGEEGDVITACKKVLNYTRPETPGSDIFDELPKFSHSSTKGSQTETEVQSPKPVFPPLSEKNEVVLLSDLFEKPKENESDPETETGSISDIEDIPEVVGVFDKEIREFKKIRVSCGKVPIPEETYFVRFFIENDIPENVIFLTKEQIPDFDCIKRGSIYNITGKFKYIESRKNWVLCEGEVVTIVKTRINGLQEPDRSRNSMKIVTSQHGETYFVSDREILEKDGPCSFELYKMVGKNTYSACNLKKL